MLQWVLPTVRGRQGCSVAQDVMGWPSTSGPGMQEPQGPPLCRAWLWSSTFPPHQVWEMRSHGASAAGAAFSDRELSAAATASRLGGPKGACLARCRFVVGSACRGLGDGALAALPAWCWWCWCWWCMLVLAPQPGRAQPQPERGPTAGAAGPDELWAWLPALVSSSSRGVCARRLLRHLGAEAKE